MPPRPCLQCGTPTTATRCTACEATRQRDRNASRPHYAGEWDRTARATIEAWVNEHGWLCPGHDTPAHEVAPGTLCCDHIQARSTDRLGVLCRPCNSRKGATTDKRT